MANIAYKRVSTTDQVTDRQLDGQEFDKVFEDKLSGKDTNRPGLEKCIEYLRDGDTLFVHSIDRMARNLRDLQDLVERITDKGATVKFNKEQLSFTKNDRDPMAELLMHVMGAFAQFERRLIRQRQKEGIVAAKRKGIKFGRKAKINEATAKEIFCLMADNVPKKEIARRLNMTRQTINKFIKNLEDDERFEYEEFARNGTRGTGGVPLG